MDTQSHEASLVTPPANTQLNEVSLTQELDPLSLTLSPPSSPWAANELLYNSDAGLPSLPHGGELNTATTPHRPNETHHLAPGAMPGRLQSLPAPSACPPGPGDALRTIVKAPRTSDTCGRKAGKAQGEKEVQIGSATAPPPQQEVVLARRGYVNNPLCPAPAPAAPLANNTCGPPPLALGAPSTTPRSLTAAGPQQEQLQQQPMAPPSMWWPGHSLPAHGSHPQCNTGSARDPTGALGVPISRRTMNQRNAALADMLLKGALSQHAHALQYCQAVQHWHALQYAEVAHDEQALQSACNQQSAQTLGAAPATPAVLTAGEPENAPNAQAMDDALAAQEVLSALRALDEHDPEDFPAHAPPAARAAPQTAVTDGLPPQGAAYAGGSVRSGASDAQLPLFAPPQVCSPPRASPAPNLHPLIDFALPAEPDTGGITDVADSLANLM